jgi:hypothetical protein
MQTESNVEIAHTLSRKRAWVVAAAAVMFLVAQAVNLPTAEPRPEMQGLKFDFWALNATLLLIGLAGGAVPWMKNRQIRALMNDEVTRSHMRSAMAVGFWTAMATAMGLYWLPAARRLDGHAAVYVIVTASVAVALLAFSWMEHRALRDA